MATVIEFVENLVNPNLMPFHGYNPRRCSIHHVDEVTELIQQTGALVHWLPPNSPDFNLLQRHFQRPRV